MIFKSPQCLNPTQRSTITWKSGSGRNGSPLGRAHCLVALCQMAGSENTPTSNIILAQQAVFRNTYVYKMHMYVQ